MKVDFFKSLKWRILIPIIILSTVASIVGTIFIIRYLDRYVTADIVYEIAHHNERLFYIAQSRFDSFFYNFALSNQGKYLVEIANLEDIAKADVVNDLKFFSQNTKNKSYIYDAKNRKVIPLHVSKTEISETLAEYIVKNSDRKVITVDINNGEKAITVSRKFAPWNWYFITIGDTEHYQDIKLILTSTIFGSIVTILSLTMAVVFYVNKKYIISPLNRIFSYLKRIKRGDYEVDFSEESLEMSHLAKEISLMSKALCDRDEKTQMLMSDIARKRKELKDITDAVSEGIVVLDSTGTVLFVNPSAERILGWPEEEIIGRDFHDTVHFQKADGTKVDKQDCPIHNSFKNNRVISIEEDVFTKKDGSIIYVTHSYTPTIYADKGLACVGTFTDITGRKKAEDEKRLLEAQFIQAQKMESLGVLAAGIAHDFNNILTVIIGYAELLQDALSDNPALSEYAENILSAGEKGANLVRQVLAFSGKQDISFKPVDLNKIILDVQKIIQSLITDDISLKIELCKSPLPVSADVTLISHAIINMVSNAKDAMPRGGELFIATDSIFIHEEDKHIYGLKSSGNYSMLSIRDTGEGMDSDTVKRIFEPFFTTKGRFKGTGLGLAMVYNTVMQHNGAIKVYSEKGRGSNFMIYLPLLSKEQYPDVYKEFQPTESLCGHGETILIADDSNAVRDVTAQILRNAGYNVIEAMDGEDAVEKYLTYKDWDIKLLILDVVMPKKNGKEVYDEIKKVSPDIKVLFRSGYTDEIVSSKEIIQGEVNFLRKPSTSTDILITVRNILNQGVV